MQGQPWCPCKRSSWHPTTQTLLVRRKAFKGNNKTEQGAHRAAGAGCGMANIHTELKTCGPPQRSTHRPPPEHAPSYVFLEGRRLRSQKAAHKVQLSRRQGLLAAPPHMHAIALNARQLQGRASAACGWLLALWIAGCAQTWHPAAPWRMLCNLIQHTGGCSAISSSPPPKKPLCPPLVICCRPDSRQSLPARPGPQSAARCVGAQPPQTARQHGRGGPTPAALVAQACPASRAGGPCWRSARPARPAVAAGLAVTPCLGRPHQVGHPAGQCTAQLRHLMGTNGRMGCHRARLHVHGRAWDALLDFSKGVSQPWLILFRGSVPNLDN